MKEYEYNFKYILYKIRLPIVIGIGRHGQCWGWWDGTRHPHHSQRSRDYRVPIYVGQVYKIQPQATNILVSGWHA